MNIHIFGGVKPSSIRIIDAFLDQPNVFRSDRTLGRYSLSAGLSYRFKVQAVFFFFGDGWLEDFFVVGFFPLRKHDFEMIHGIAMGLTFLKKGKVWTEWGMFLFRSYLEQERITFASFRFIRCSLRKHQDDQEP